MSMNKKFLIAASLVTIIIAVALTVTLTPPNNKTSKLTQQKPFTETKPASTNGGTREPVTIAQQWQWETLSDTANERAFKDVQLPFTPQSVHDALQAVKIDKNDNIVLDHDALLSLDEALERIYNKLDGDTLKQLRELIEQALPGAAGQQTAKLVEDYSAFLKAKEQFSQTYEGSPPPYDQQSVASISSDEALYSELKALRQTYLGDDTATKLFAVSDATAQFMFDTMKLEFDNTLTPEQKNERRVEHQQQLNATITPAPDQ